MPLASVIMDEAAGLLNDASKTVFTYDVQLPFLKSAWNKLQMKLQENGIPVMKEVSAVTDVAANATVITLPSDFLQPISIEERADGSTDSFEPTIEVDAIPQLDTQAEEILYWTWREETLEINSPSTAREVKLTYWKSLNPCTSSSSNLNVINSTEYLANKTAALVARFSGENPTRADALDIEAAVFLSSLVNIEVKKLQSVAVRPRSYGSKA